MTVTEYKAAMWEHRFANEDDRKDFRTAHISASLDTVIAASTRLIERGTADAEAMAMARVMRAQNYLRLNLLNAAYADLAKALALATAGKNFVLLALSEAEGRRHRSAASVPWSTSTKPSP